MLEKHYDEKKGFGYIATINIPRNTIVFSENIIDELVDDGLHMLEKIYILSTKYKKRFDKLAPRELDENVYTIEKYFKQFGYMDTKLLKHFDSISTDDFRLYCAKYNRNKFGIQIDDGIIIHIFQFESSFFNNSCDPNMAFILTENNKKLQISFVTTRDVKSGEELCIGYHNNIEETCKRKKSLKETYGFDCTCSQCLMKCTCYSCKFMIKENDSCLKKIYKYILEMLFYANMNI